MTDLKTIALELRERFANAVIEVIEFRGQVTLVVQSEHLVELATFLRDEMAFNMFTDLCAVDHLPRDPRFDLNYQLYSMSHNIRLRLKVRVLQQAAQVQSVTGVWPGANWYEREVYDLFGITFVGHPDLRRLLLPEDYMGHPMRRDHLGLYVEQVQFTHNFDEIDSQKPYAMPNT